MVILAVMVKFSFAQFDYGFDFSKAGTSGFQFLKIGIGAKEVGFGSAVSSTVNDAAAVFWNPAGIGWLTSRHVFMAHNTWLADSKHSALAYAMPLGSFVVAANIAVMSIKEFEETTVDAPTGTGRMVGAGDLVLGLAIARKYTDQLSIGIQVKYVQEKLDEVTFSNFLFDVGTIYYTGFRDLRLAFTLQHFGPDKKMFDQNFKMPLLFRLGAADNIINNENLRITAAVDLVHPTDNNEWVSIGLEAGLMKYFSLRGGYRINVDEGDFSLGFGLESPDVMGVLPRLDYAYVSYGDIFGATHRFSLAFSF
jgi:hypothetical protein